MISLERFVTKEVVEAAMLTVLYKLLKPNLKLIRGDPFQTYLFKLLWDVIS
jgi:hypothetical protein